MDRATAQTWRVETETCQSCLVLEASQDNDAELKDRPRGRKYSIHRAEH